MFPKWLIGIFFLLSSLAASSQAPSKLTLSFNQTSFSEAIQQIKSVSDYKFAFNSGEFKDHFITEEFRSASIEEVLDEILPKSYKYRIRNRLIVIFKVDDNQEWKGEAAKEKISIRGTVIDLETKETLPYAYISIRTSGYTTESDNKGFFVLNEIPSDTTSILITYIGYRDKVFYLNPDMDLNNISIRLSIETETNPAIVRPELFPLQSKKEASLQEINTLKTQDLSQVGSTDALAPLKILTGITASNEGTNSYGIRGFKSDENLILLDGYAIQNPEHFFGAFSAINSLSVKNIRVHKGISSSEFGGNNSSVIEITSFDGNKDKLSGVLKTGVLSTSLRLDGPLLNKKSSFSISGRHSHFSNPSNFLYRDILNSIYNSNASFINDSQEIDVVDSDVVSDVVFRDLQAKLNFQISQKTDLGLSYFYSSDRSNQNFTDSVVDLNLFFHFDNKFFWENYGGSIDFNSQITPKTTFTNITAYTDLYNQSDSEEMIDDLLFNESELLQNSEVSTLNQLSNKTKFTSHLSDSIKLVLGAEIIRYEIDFESRIFGFLEANSSSNLTTINPFISSDIYFKKFKFKAGLRSPIVEGDLFLEPRIKLNYFVNPFLNLKASFGVQNQFLRKTIPFNFFLGNLNQWELAKSNEVVHGNSSQFSFGSHYSKKNFNLDIELININQNNSIENLSSILYIGNSSSTDLEDLSLANINSKGIEINGQINSFKSSFSIGYSLYNSEIQLQNSSENVTFRNPRMPTHNLTAFWLWDNDKFSFNTLGIFTSGNPYTPALGSYTLPLANGSFRPFIIFGENSSATLPAYFRFDFSASYKFIFSNKMSLKINGAIQNMFNRSNLKLLSYSIIGSNNSPNFLILEREINHLGRIPSLFLTLKF